MVRHDPMLEKGQRDGSSVHHPRFGFGHLLGALGRVRSCCPNRPPLSSNDLSQVDSNGGLLGHALHIDNAYRQRQRPQQ